MKRHIPLIVFALIVTILAGFAIAQNDGNYAVDYNQTITETLTLGGAVNDTTTYTVIRWMPHLNGQITCVATIASNDSGAAYDIQGSLDGVRWFTLIDSMRGIPDGTNKSVGWTFEKLATVSYFRGIGKNASLDTATVRFDWKLR